MEFFAEFPNVKDLVWMALEKAEQSRREFARRGAVFVDRPAMKPCFQRGEVHEAFSVQTGVLSGEVFLNWCRELGGAGGV
ncbi:MAG: hypothetical protein O3C40_25135 [Planctomycetota bacterium]|nr:hypothetical protein [Planctomycetota bacterium]